MKMRRCPERERLSTTRATMSLMGFLCEHNSINLLCYLSYSHRRMNYVRFSKMGWMCSLQKTLKTSWDQSIFQITTNTPKRDNVKTNSKFVRHISVTWQLAIQHAWRRDGALQGNSLSTTRATMSLMGICRTHQSPLDIANCLRSKFVVQTPLRKRNGKRHSTTSWMMFYLTMRQICSDHTHQAYKLHQQSVKTRTGNGRPATQCFQASPRKTKK